VALPLGLSGKWFQVSGFRFRGCVIQLFVPLAK
jgi:hypothetical protein